MSFTVQCYQEFFGNFIHCQTDDEYPAGFPLNGLFSTRDEAKAYLDWSLMLGPEYRQMTWRIAEIVLTVLPSKDN